MKKEKPRFLAKTKIMLEENKMSSISLKLGLDERAVEITIITDTEIYKIELLNLEENQLTDEEVNRVNEVLDEEINEMKKRLF